MWRFWWLMLVVDCCDLCPGPKATNRCLPGTVHRGSWWLVDILVVGCYAYTTQLKIVIFLKIGCLLISIILTLPNFFFSSMGSKNISYSKEMEVWKRQKIERWIWLVFCHFLVVPFSNIGIAAVDSQVGFYWALSLSSPPIDFTVLVLFMLFHVPIFQIYSKLLCLKLGEINSFFLPLVFRWRKFCEPLLRLCLIEVFILTKKHNFLCWALSVIEKWRFEIHSITIFDFWLPLLQTSILLKDLHEFIFVKIMIKIYHQSYE